eukprot:12714876-Alexandrium_andersonii.AAC.1
MREDLGADDRVDPVVLHQHQRALAWKEACEMVGVPVTGTGWEADVAMDSGQGSAGGAAPAASSGEVPGA